LSQDFLRSKGRGKKQQLTEAKRDKSSSFTEAGDGNLEMRGEKSPSDLTLKLFISKSLLYRRLGKRWK
jgi:hypothetical protein